MPVTFLNNNNSNKRLKRKSCNNDDDDEEGPGIPIDPGQLMSAMFQKPDDIKTDGNKIYFYKDNIKRHFYLVIEIQIDHLILEYLNSQK